jgi:hypothetical protein
MDPGSKVIKLQAEIFADPDDPDNLVLDLGVDICQQLGWQEGDQLQWTDNKDGTWTLTKKTPD